MSGINYQIPTLTYPEVRERFPEAWDALPECYQADSCLTFWTDVNGHLLADHDQGQTFLYSEAQKDWVETWP